MRKINKDNPIPIWERALITVEEGTALTGIGYLMKRTFLVKKDPTIEAQGNWLIMDYRQYAAWRETDEGKNREIVFGKFEACSEDDSIIFMECNEKVSKELKKDCHRKQYIRSRDAETPFQVMSYSTMTFQESEIYGEDVLEDTECNVEESVMQRILQLPKNYDTISIGFGIDKDEMKRLVIALAELDLTIDEWLCFKMKELILAEKLSKENRGEE